MLNPFRERRVGAVSRRIDVDHSGKRATREIHRTRVWLPECHFVTVSPDPLGGSYVIEELTDRLEREAADYIRRIDDMGGTLRAIETGFIQGEIQNAAFEFQKGVESGRNVIVAAHGNSLRALIMKLENLSGEEILKREFYVFHHSHITRPFLSKALYAFRKSTVPNRRRQKLLKRLECLCLWLE